MPTRLKLAAKSVINLKKKKQDDQSVTVFTMSFDDSRSSYA